MILGGQLESAPAGADCPQFTIKGAVAIEMRLPKRARATRDLDLIVDDPAHPDLALHLRSALEGSYQGFTFRVRGEAHRMPNNSVRVDVALEYGGRGWGTIQVDLSPGEGDQTEVDLVQPLALEPFGLETPDPLPCLSLRYHIAQKIHAMTEPPFDEGTPNERFRDLVDVLLMKDLTTDLADVKEACVEVFATRATHDWPPRLDPPAFWEEPFAALSEGVGLPTRPLEDAVAEAQAFIDALASA